MTNLITRVENKYMKKDIPLVEPGDSVRVQLRIAAGGSDETATRIHTFAGTVIACKGGGINRSITVRRVTYGIGVERTFPLHSPTVVDVEIVRQTVTNVLLASRSDGRQLSKIPPLQIRRRRQCPRPKQSPVSLKSVRSPRRRPMRSRKAKPLTRVRTESRNPRKFLKSPVKIQTLECVVF